MRVYISGAITGTSDYISRFAEAQKKLEEQGYSVINPAAVNSAMPKDTAYEEYMKMAFAMLDLCGAVYMMDGWEKSCGANREYGYALGRGKKVMFEEKGNKQYRETGIMEEIKRMQRYSALAEKHDTIGRAIEACAEYEEIGTVEECREAVEKQTACVPKRKMMISPLGGWTAYCRCGTMVRSFEKYCSRCGQALDWSGGEETSAGEESGG